MQFSINLATQPYQDAGRFYRRWLLLLGFVTVFSAALVYSAVGAYRSSRAVGRIHSEQQHRLSQLSADEKTDEAILGRAENSDVWNQSQFLNDVIRRKAFSWTELFADLEGLMPPRLHVVSIQPELTPDYQLAIKMTVAGDSRERALELVRRMEQSKAFRMPAVQSESSNAQPPDTIKVDISTLYSPQGRTDQQPRDEMRTRTLAKAVK